MTVFASVTNSGAEAAVTCRVTPPAGTTLTVAYQRTDANNALIGAENEPFSIAAGATQSLLLTFRLAAGGSGLLPVVFRCVGATSATSVTARTIIGVNVPVVRFHNPVVTFRPADIIPIAVTPSGDAVVRLPSAGGQQVMVAAAVNLGVAHTIKVKPTADLFANPDSGASIAQGPYRYGVIGKWAQQPFKLYVCETNAAGACLAPLASEVQVSWAANETKYFTVLAVGYPGAGAPFFPDITRSVLEFRYASVTSSDLFANWLVGSASASVTGSAPTIPAGTPPYGVYSVLWRDADGNLVYRNDPLQGTFAVIPPAAGSQDLATLYYFGTQKFAEVTIISGGMVSAGGDTFTVPAMREGASSTTWPITIGVHTPGVSLIGNHGKHPSNGEWPNYVGEFRAVANPEVFDRPTTIADLAGSYLLVGTVGGGDYAVGSMTVSGAGTVSISYRNCTGFGSVTPVVAGKALFVLSVTMDACADAAVSQKTYRVPYVFLGDRTDPNNGLPVTRSRLAYIPLQNATKSELLMAYLQ